MRITSSMVRSEGLATIRRNLRAIRDAQAEVVDGRRIRALSDDPAASTTLLATDGRLRALDQYGRNIGAARARLQAEESVLDQLGDVLTRGRELALSQAGGTATTQTRQITQKETDELLATVIQLANTRFGNAYLFGGVHADLRPFDNAGQTDALRPPAGAQAFEIGEQQQALGPHDALDVFSATDAVESLRDLSAALAGDDGDAIAAAGARVTAAFEAVQVLLGEVGARTVRLEIAEANVDALRHNLRTLRSDLADVDLEEAVSHLVARQSAFEAALMATSRVLQTTLAHYLR